MKKITVIGATGMIGIPVTKELIKAGYEITALVRDVDKARTIFPTNINFIKGDLYDKASITEALKDAEGLYINISTRPTDKESNFNPETQGLDNLLSAVKQSNIKQIAYLSSFLARNYQGNWWVMKAKKESISKIKQVGIPYTIFYPSNFMENFRQGMVQGKRVTIMGKPINKAWWIAGEDFGRQIASAFSNEKSFNKEYSVQGLEALDILEAATIYAKNYNKEKLTVAKLPLGLFNFLGLFITPLKFVANLMYIMMNNHEEFEAKSTWDDLGKPTITIEKFAKQS
ncbi:MAG: NmrA family NAD(P)-binding protein [Candidatus Falkowbacteria bacterium]|nr:NmrA family NAD(P)-binding protein [Candidatus Falkowbacteria bacterium]